MTASVDSGWHTRLYTIAQLFANNFACKPNSRNQSDSLKHPTLMSACVYFSSNTNSVITVDMFTKILAYSLLVN